jgi:hypothetical protein
MEKFSHKISISLHWFYGGDYWEFLVPRNFIQNAIANKGTAQEIKISIGSKESKISLFVVCFAKSIFSHRFFRIFPFCFAFLIR